MREHDHSGTKRKPLVVFAGRSNVGKSSTIRALTGIKIKVGKKPGSTRWEHRIDLGSVVLIDFPGFGYMAGQSKTSVDEMKTRIVHTLERMSERIAVAILVIDVSLFRVLFERWNARGEIPIDVEFYTFLSEIAANVIIVANKIDKVKKKEQERELMYLREKLEIALPDHEPVIIATTAKKKKGIGKVKKEIESNLKTMGIENPHW